MRGSLVSLSINFITSSIQNLIHFCRHFVLDFFAGVWINRVECLETLFSYFLCRIHEPIAHAVEASAYGNRANKVFLVEHERGKADEAVLRLYRHKLDFGYGCFRPHGFSLLRSVALPSAQKLLRTGSRADLLCVPLRRHQAPRGMYRDIAA